MVGFATTYGALPQLFHRAIALSPVPRPRWIVRNDALAKKLGIDAAWFAGDQALAALSGNAPLPDAAPLAMAYSGHQFGGWAPLLGDGRALLAGEWLAPDGIRFDLHLKGSGPTPFSRNGDGRATLGAMLREYIVSEAMAGLGIATTRSLAVVATGEPVHRQVSEPGAVLTRVALSHVRVGTFQFAAVNGTRADLAALADREIARNYPEISGPELYRDFLRAVIARQANLVARWMCVGFIHGVMNTDNMSVAGETIDYGPCAFMDAFHPQKVFSSIDQFGRYAWDKQPAMALWNLTRLAESLLPLLHEERDAAIALATSELERFMPDFERHFESGMRLKFGLAGPHDSDGTFIANMLTHLMTGGVDFTLFFRRLTQVAADKPELALRKLFNDAAVADATLTSWRERVALTGTVDLPAMELSNPVIIARNHRVEEAIRAADQGELAPFQRLVAALQNPFVADAAFEDFELAPLPDEIVARTFCGT